MRRLIEQLLDLSRLDSGKVRLDRQDINVRDFLTTLVGSLRDVELHVDSDLVARVDPLVLERVVANLVANARTYGEPPVRLDSVVDGTTLKLVIEDHGPGVPMELVPRLFDRFVRGHEGHGTGLGLAIARAYTSSHDGDLRYARAQHGARFEIVLPGALVS